jgi:hypothetical protein
MAKTTWLSPRAEDIVRNANSQFEDTVTEADVVKFDSTELEELKQAAQGLEKILEDDGKMPNMARLMWFYTGVEWYSRACAKMDKSIVHLSRIWVCSR